MLTQTLVEITVQTQETQWSKCGQALLGPLLAALEIPLCNELNL